MKHNQPEIVEVLQVVDTREYVEDRFDRWVPLAGTGTVRECDRCGRGHEVHATVRLSDGGEAVVGTGCMKASTIEVAAKLRRAVSAAKRIASLRATVAGLEALTARQAAVVAEIVAAPIEVTFEERERAGRPGEKFAIARCGGAQQWFTVGEWNPARQAELVSHARQIEVDVRVRAVTGYHVSRVQAELAHARRQLDRAQGRLEAATV